MNRSWWVPVLLPALALAQQDTAWAPNMPKQHRATLDVHACYDSNVLYNDLVTNLYRGGSLDPAARQRSMDALGDANRAGYDLGGKATYAWGDSLFGHPDWMPRFSLSHESALGARFAPDAYALSFFGNGNFEDRTAHIGPGDFVQVNYQGFSFGMEDRRTGSFVELSVVNGRSLNTGHIAKADLYTAPYGRYLELQLDGRYQRSDTAGNRMSNGIGAAINLEWKHQLRLFGSPAVASLGISDLGFIAWNGNSLSVTKDSTLHYEGIEVTDILDLDGILVNSSTLQDSLGLGYSTGMFTTVLPAKAEARITFGKLRKTVRDERQAYTIAIDYRYLPGYVPRARITRDFAVGKCLIANVGAGYGGFGGLRAVFGLEALVGKGFTIGLGTPNAVGLCSGQARGKAVALRLETTW